MAGETATSFAGTGVTPDVHYHLNTSAVTTTTVSASPANIEAITSLADLRGLANATNGGTTGPFVLTDPAGNKFARFDNSNTLDGPNPFNYLTIANTLASVAQRSVSVFMIGRHHRTDVTFLSLGVNGASPPNTSGGVMKLGVANSGNTPFLSSYSRYANAPTSGDASRIILGSQLQLMGVASRSATVATANGGIMFFVNNDFVKTERASVALTGTGGEIGRNSYNGATGAGGFDLYEMVIFKGDLTDVQAQAVAAAMVANWAIPAIVDQLILEGDSITQGVGATSATAGTRVIGSENLGMQLTKPGALLVPATTRVVSLGTSGNAVSNLVTRRDTGVGIYSLGKLSTGRNVIAVQIGRNDLPSKTAAATYAEIVALINTTTTGYLQRGFEVAQMINIASASSMDTPGLRALLRSASFLTDCNAGPGQTYDGKLFRKDLAEITVGGDTKFSTSADAADTAYMQPDSTHPNRVGTLLMATGGDTPQNGYASIIANDNSVEVAPGLLTNAQTFYAPTVARGAVNLSAPLIGLASSVFEPIVAPGTAGLAAPLISNSQTLYAPSVLATYQLAAPAITSGLVIYEPAIESTAGLTAPLLINSSSVFAPVVSTGGSLLAPPLISDGDQFFAASVSGGTVTLTPALVINSQTFFAATVLGSGVLAPALLLNAQSFPAATVAPGAAQVAPALLGNAQAFFAPTVGRGSIAIAPPRIANDNAFLPASIQLSGARILLPPRVNNVSIFPAASLFVPRRPTTGFGSGSYSTGGRRPAAISTGRRR